LISSLPELGQPIGRDVNLGGKAVEMSHGRQKQFLSARVRDISKGVQGGSGNIGGGGKKPSSACVLEGSDPVTGWQPGRQLLI